VSGEPTTQPPPVKIDDQAWAVGIHGSEQPHGQHRAAHWQPDLGDRKPIGVRQLRARGHVLETRTAFDGTLGNGLAGIHFRHPAVIVLQLGIDGHGGEI